MGAGVAALLLTAVIVTFALSLREAPGCRHPRRHAGIDVSSFQHTIDWRRVANTCVGFAYVRFAFGTTPDETYTANAAGARAVGLAVGAYQYFHPEQNVAAQAQLFVFQAGYRAGDLAPVLDVETTEGVSRRALLAAVRSWLLIVGAELRVRPMIYTNPSFWTTSVHSRALTRYPLWIAHYTSAARPSVPQGNWGGHGWTVWQYDAHGRVAGIPAPVDLDRSRR